MEFLSEHTIKKSAMRFFKTHYKYRDRIGETTAQIDMTTPEGIIIDGFYRFRSDRNQTFIASFEATSQHSIHEIKYKIRKEKLIWESFSFALLFFTIIFSILYLNKNIVFGREYLFVAILIVIISIASLFFLFRLILPYFSAYRQIYALEQFKLYQANEQWVAIGEDVFYNVEDKYFLELKRQCVINGFGLMIISDDAEVRKVITPSHKPLHKNRQRRTFLDNFNINKNVENYTEMLISPEKWEKEGRFKFDYRLHLTLILLCLTILTAFFWKEAQKTKVNSGNDNKYKRQLEKLKEDLKKEGNFYIIEDGYVIDYKGLVQDYDLNHLQVDNYEVDWYKKYQQDSLFEALLDPSIADKNALIDSLNELLAKDSIIIKKRNQISTTPKPRSKANSNANNLKWCKDQYFGNRTFYMLKDGVYKDRKTAEFRVSQINKASSMAGIVKGGCFKELKPYYVVYVDVLYHNEERAKAALPYFNELLKFKGYSSGELELVHISPKYN